ncbi:hypothetical protein [Alicyclobacillus fastidiosus]|uniref:Copper amine oxidase-like N-terminal domain-containing protein n=1 Tax=Alicyclobacillus fastidiosus TaxID=392011 RepID=A0ABV5AMA7_9BACL
MIKCTGLSIVTGLLGIQIVSATTAMASTSSHKMQLSKIVLNGHTVSTQYKFVGGAPVTTYMPVYYVQQLINKVLGTDTSTDVWNGTEHTWTLTVPRVTPSKISSGSGSAISVNGTVIEAAPTIVDVDPSSGQQTTFMPIWYVQQLLNQILNLSPGTDTWNGGTSTPTWMLTTTATGSSESQSSMANAMWKVFNSTSYDIHTHSTMEQAGVTPTNAPVTAEQVADWVKDWAVKSKGYTLSGDIDDNGKIYAKGGTWIPFSLQYESSTDPYTWAKENDLFQGTNVSLPSSVISSSDASKISSNLSWWLNGFKFVNGVVHLHVPMYGNYQQYVGEVEAEGTSISDYRSALADGANYIDKATATITNGTLNLTLPSLTASFSRSAWEVDARGFSYGWNGASTLSNSLGGVTLHIPLNNNVPGFTLNIKSTKANLTGYALGYTYTNTAMSWFAIDEAND